MLQITVNDNRAFEIDNEDGVTHVNNVAATPDINMQPNGLISILLDGKSYTAIVENVDTAKKEISVRVNGQRYDTSIQEPIDLLLSNMGLDLKAMQKAEPVKAPMPGMVLKILVSPGQKIEKGDGIIILEAMKMENILKATGPATVKAIRVNEQTAVEKGAILIELE